MPITIIHSGSVTADNKVDSEIAALAGYRRTQQQIARTAGVRFDGSLHVDSLSGADGPAPTYLALIEHDIDAILEGLSR